MAMEDFPLFNAGHGSALCDDGSVELSASAMRGSDQAAGAVAVLRRTRHPVAAAAALLDEPRCCSPASRPTRSPPRAGSSSASPRSS